MSGQPHHALRRLLRLVKTPPLAKELLLKHSSTQQHHNNNIRTLISQEYRSRSQATTISFQGKRLSNLACRYQELLGNLQERQRLYDLDKGAEERLSPKELSRRAAARAGLQLPDASAIN
jgi:hypothetical protein